MANRDHYYNRAKQEGYRSRAAYKLKQLDEAANLVSRGDVIVDLGAAPGGWLQVAAELAGPDGRVLGVDRQRIDAIESGAGRAPVETIVGDLTEDETREAIVDRVGRADVVLSDMAPNVSGQYELDHARSIHLARRAVDVAVAVLAAGGDLCVKLFEGPDRSALRENLATEFDHVRIVVPDATRPSSSELYLVGKGRLTAPVDVGDRLEVTVEATGDEGDGIAKVDGFTLFVPGVGPGETVEVAVTDVKPRYGFAQRVDE